MGAGSTRRFGRGRRRRPVLRLLAAAAIALLLAATFALRKEPRAGARLSSAVSEASAQLLSDLARHASLASDDGSAWNITGPGGSSSSSSSSSASAPLSNHARAAQRRFKTAADEWEAERSLPTDGPESQGLPCRESGYCSVGKLQPYVGEVDSLEGYKKALLASCYKKECIQLCIGSSGHLLGLNFASSAWTLGLANVMLIGKNQQTCEQLGKYGYKNITCVWSQRDWLRVTQNSTLHMFEAEEIWVRRYLLMARAVWLGFNVWLLDTDSYLYHDPYKYLKAPPLSNITFMSLRDGGNVVNGGSSYIHNAIPGGPAAWTIATVVDRMLRYNEDWEWWKKAHNVTNDHLGHAILDQQILSDVMAGNKIRHPYVRFTFPHAQRVRKDVENLIQYDSSRVLLQYPPEWRNVTVVESDSVPGFNLTIPFLNGTWNEEIGGLRFGPRSNYSQAFLQMLEEESGYKYHDIEGAPPEGYREQNETFIFTPDFLLSSWLGRGVRGWWDLVPPPQVMIHALYVPGDLHPPWKKEHCLKAHNAFDWNVARAVDGKLFRSATDADSLPRVLALLPGVRLESNSAVEFRDKLAQLVRLATRLNRVMLLPEHMCNVSWASPQGTWGRHPDVLGHVKFHYDYRAMWYGVDDDQHCLWWRTLDPNCMPGAYIAHTDYKELVRRLPAEASRPGPENTLRFDEVEQPGGQAAGQQGQQAAGSSNSSVTAPAGGGDNASAQNASAPAVDGSGNSSGPGAVRLAAVLEAARKKEGPHILFIGALPDLSAGQALEGDEQKFQQWNSSCSWAKELPKEQRRRRQSRRRLGEREHHEQQRREEQQREQWRDQPDHEQQQREQQQHEQQQREEQQGREQQREEPQWWQSVRERAESERWDITDPSELEVSAIPN